MELSQRVIREDHKLDGAAEHSREELARHRWHWTLDESNPKRVSIREYARAVGRGFTTIRDTVTGYADYLASDRNVPITEFIHRAKLLGDDLAATEAVAEAEGVTVGTARVHKAGLVREVKATAQERALRNSTTVADEAVKVAQDRKRAADARKSNESDRKRAMTARYIEVEGKVATAKRVLTQALEITEGVDFGDDERDLIRHALDELRALLNLIDVRVTGNAGIDWDSELSKITGGTA